MNWKVFLLNNLVKLNDYFQLWEKLIENGKAIEDILRYLLCTLNSKRDFKFYKLSVLTDETIRFKYLRELWYWSHEIIWTKYENYCISLPLFISLFRSPVKPEAYEFLVMLSSSLIENNSFEKQKNEEASDYLEEIGDDCKFNIDSDNSTHSEKLDDELNMFADDNTVENEEFRKPILDPNRTFISDKNGRCSMIDGLSDTGTDSIRKVDADSLEFKKMAFCFGDKLNLYVEFKRNQLQKARRKSNTLVKSCNLKMTNLDIETHNSETRTGPLDNAAAPPGNSETRTGPLDNAAAPSDNSETRTGPLDNAVAPPGNSETRTGPLNNDSAASSYYSTLAGDSDNSFMTPPQ